MAGKIDFTVSANADKALSDLAKVINKQDKMIDKLKEQDRQAKKTGKSFGEAGKPLKQMALDAAGIAAGFFSAQAAIGGFKAIISQLKTEMDYFIQKSQRAGQAQFGFSQATTEAFRTTYGTANLDRNIAAAYSALPPNVSPGEIATQLTAYKGAHPASQDPNDFIAAMIANAGPVSAVGREQQIGLTGQLQSLMPAYSANDAASVASMLINQTGRMSGSLPAAMQGIFQLSGPSGMGADPEAVLARIVTGAQRKVKPRGFTSMASTLQMLQQSAASYQRRPGTAPTGRGQLYQDIRAAGGDEDINALMDFLDVLPDDRWKYISSGQTIRPMFGPGVVSGGRSGIRNAITDNLAGAELSDIRRSGHGGFAFATESGQAAINRMMLENTGGLTGGISRLVQDALVNMPGQSELASRIDRTMLNARWAMGADPAEAAVAYLGNLENQYGPMRTTVSSAGTGAPGRPFTGPNPDANPDLVKTLQQLQVTIQQMADSYDLINENKNIGSGID
jgi:hypothetical protein